MNTGKLLVLLLHVIGITVAMASESEEMPMGLLLRYEKEEEQNSDNHAVDAKAVGSKVQISQDQKQEMAQAIKEIFQSQQSTTSGYGHIIHAMGQALESPEVKASAQKVLQELRGLVSNFMKNLELSKENQRVVRDILDAMEQTIELQTKQLNKPRDDVTQQKIAQLHDRLSKHMIIVFASLDGAAVKESWTENQLYILGVITQLVKEALTYIPISSVLSDPMVLGEPAVPEILNLEQMQGDEAD